MCKFTVFLESIVNFYCSVSQFVQLYVAKCK